MKPRTKALAWSMSGALYVGLFGLVQSAFVALTAHQFIAWAFGWVLVTVAVAVFVWMRVSSNIDDATKTAADLEWELNKLRAPAERKFND